MVMRVAFAGTPEFAAAILRSLMGSGHDLVAVFTQPDRPAGRGRRLSPSAVKLLAEAIGVPVFQPDSFRDGSGDALLAACTPDIFIVAAYGLILPASTLDIPRHGSINVHASLLPRWRGAAPIQRAILAGDRETGISIMQMDAGLDTGPVIETTPCPIEPRDTARSLHDRLAALAGPSLLGALASIERGSATATLQPDDGVTYAHRLTKAEADLDWTRDAIDLDRSVRAYDPWPVAHTWLPGSKARRLRIWQAQAADEPNGTPGTVLDCSRDGIVVAAGRGALILEEVQIEGSKRMAVSEFLNARPIEPGLGLGGPDGA